MSKLPLSSVTIDGFRGLRKLHMERMGRINILVGENNSGKTSVLEALQILCNPIDPQEWLAMVRRRDFGGLDETRLQSLRWCFSQSTENVDDDVAFQSTCMFACEGTFEVERLFVEYHEMEGFPDERTLRNVNRYRSRVPDIEVDEPWQGAEIIHHVKSNQWPGIEPIEITIWERERSIFRRPHRRRDSLPFEVLSPYSYQMNQLQVRSRSRQLFSSQRDLFRSKEMLLDLLRQFDSEIEDVEIASLRGDRPAIYIRHRKLGAAPLSIFGDAIRRSVLLASELASLKGGGLLLVDEIEAGIHVSALERVFGWLAEVADHFDVQVVLTTHSLEAVDALLAGVKASADLVTYHLGQKKGETRNRRISGESLKSIRQESGLDPR